MNIERSHFKLLICKKFIENLKKKIKRIQLKVGTTTKKRGSPVDTPRKNGVFKGRFGVIMDSVFRPRTGFYGRNFYASCIKVEP